MAVLTAQCRNRRIADRQTLESQCTVRFSVIGVASTATVSPTNPQLRRSALVVEGTQTDDVRAFAGGASSTSWRFGTAGLLDTGNEAATSGCPPTLTLNADAAEPAAFGKEFRRVWRNGQQVDCITFGCVLERMALTSASRLLAGIADFTHDNEVGWSVEKVSVRTGAVRRTPMRRSFIADLAVFTLAVCVGRNGIANLAEGRPGPILNDEVPRSLAQMAVQGSSHRFGRSS